MSFNYTPPPPEVVQAGENATYALFIVLLLAPKARYGALLGGLGAATIEWWVTGHAGGDLGAVSQVIGTPFLGVIGAVVGAGASVVGQLALKLIRLLLYRPRQNMVLKLKAKRSREDLKK